MTTDDNYENRENMDLSDHPRLFCISSKFDVIINSNPFTIGRNTSCDYIIPNQVISRLHCQIEKNGSQWFLRDKSTNGTFLNGVLIKLDVSPPLKDTDVIQLSDDSYKYIFQYKCTSREDISDEQLCRIADSVLQNLEVSTQPVPNTSDSIINISDSSVPINTVSSAPTSHSQPNKKIKVTHNIIDLTNESYKYEIEAPSTSNTNESQVIDLSESFPLPTNTDSKMVIQSLFDVKDKPELRSEIASTSTCAIMGQADSQRCVEKEVIDDVESQEDLLCAICSEMFVKATTLNCSHTFCKFCIETWKKKQRYCPICRAKITSEVGTLVLDNFIEKIIQTSTQDVRERRKELLEERKKNEHPNKNNKSKAACLFQRHRDDTSDDTTFYDTSDSEVDDDDLNSEWHDDWSYRTPYYGGYGNCFSCGRSGHWASGCPFR